MNSLPTIQIRYVEDSGWCAEINTTGNFEIITAPNFVFQGHKTKAILLQEVNARYFFRAKIIQVPKDTLHRKLVDIAYKWVLKNGSCGVAIKEKYSAAMENPDVIGFGCGTSLVVEVKTSRTDFLNDKKKPFRQIPSLGMGLYRYYLCPTDLIKIEELPEGWGLIYVNDKGKARLAYRPIVEYPTEKGNTYKSVYRHDRNIKQENLLMYSVLRRMQLSGHIDEMYNQ